MIWAPFDFLTDGKVDHCGTDLFNLVRIYGNWFIASVADTATLAKAFVRPYLRKLFSCACDE